jgi:hypothetical protein
MPSPAKVRDRPDGEVYDPSATSPKWIRITSVNDFHKREMPLQHNKLIKSYVYTKTHTKKKCVKRKKLKREMTEWWGEEVDDCSLDLKITHTS